MRLSIPIVQLPIAVFDHDIVRTTKQTYDLCRRGVAFGVAAVPLPTTFRHGSQGPTRVRSLMRS